MNPMNIVQEYLPFNVDYETVNSTPKWQGNTNACTRFGLCAALKTMAERGGYVFDPSVRYLWWFTDKVLLSVESSVATLNTVGTCDESLYPWKVNTAPPYTIIDIEKPPSTEAVNQAKLIKYNVKVKRIQGKEQIKRSIAKGHCLIICSTLGSIGEHVEAVIGYDEKKGMKVYGSSDVIYYEPWSSLTNIVITQVWELYNTPWDIVPHPEYIEGTKCYIEKDIMVIPTMRAYIGWPNPSLFFKNIVIKLENKGTVIYDNIGFVDENIWHSPKSTLMLPEVIIDGVVNYNVKLVNPSVSVLYHEVDELK